MEELKHIIDLYKQNRYKIISDRMIEVDSQIVTKQIKKGREIITCSCENAGRFASNQLCRHKQFFILFPLLKKLDNYLTPLIDEYKIGETIGTNEEKKLFFHFREILENIKRGDYIKKNEQPRRNKL